jgi:hypothetical protein
MCSRTFLACSRTCRAPGTVGKTERTFRHLSLGKVNLPTPIPTLRPSYLNLPAPAMRPAHGRFVLKKAKNNNFQPSGGGEKTKIAMSCAQCPVAQFIVHNVRLRGELEHNIVYICRCSSSQHRLYLQVFQFPATPNVSETCRSLSFSF